MSQINIFRLSDYNNDDYIARLPNEIIIFGLLVLLDDKDLQNLSRTCRRLHRLVRLNRFGIVSPIWEDAEVVGSENLSASCYRNGVVVNNALYIPIFTSENPYCLVIDFSKSPLELAQNPIKIESNTKNDFEPCDFMATTAIGSIIYIFGGQNIITGNITNAFYELNANTYELRKIYNISNISNLPKPRMMHTFCSIDNHRLALFGGRCFMNRFYNSDQLAIYDTRQNSWTICNEKTASASRRSRHSTVFMNGKIYIYGGDQVSSFSTTRTRFDDPDVWEYDTLKSKWKKYLNPKNEISSKFLPENLIQTSGPTPLKRYNATIFPMHKQIVILGGNKVQDNEEENRPWEFMEILSLKRHSWVHLRIRGMPRIGDVAIYRIEPKGVFVLGKDQKEGKLVMGWIKDKQ